MAEAIPAGQAGSGENRKSIEPDTVDKPAHYTYSAVEPLDVIEAWDLPYHLGCAVKYIARYRHKGSPLEDLRKARRYLDRYIGLMEGRDLASIPDAGLEDIFRALVETQKKLGSGR